MREKRGLSALSINPSPFLLRRESLTGIFTAFIARQKKCLCLIVSVCFDVYILPYSSNYLILPFKYLLVYLFLSIIYLIPISMMLSWPLSGDYAQTPNSSYF